MILQMMHIVRMSVIVTACILFVVFFIMPTFASAASVDLKVNKGDDPVTFSGSKRLPFSWSSTDVKKTCILSVASGTPYRVAPKGSRLLIVSSDAPYVSLTCDHATTGVAMSDKIVIKDPEGRINLSVSQNATRTVTASVHAHFAKKRCSNNYFGTLYWGDGVKEKVVPGLQTGECSIDVRSTRTHTYTEPRTYTVTFEDNFRRKKTQKITIAE